MDVRRTARRWVQSWYHRELMESYYAARTAQEAAAEAYSNGHETELAEFYALNRRVTFKDWLVDFAAALGYREAVA